MTFEGKYKIEKFQSEKAKKANELSVQETCDIVCII
jgi:hypothetical protein